MKRAFLAVVLGLVCGMAGWCLRGYGPSLGLPGPSHSAGTTAGRASTSASDGGAAENAAVVGMGRIDPAGGVIDVGAMMGDRLGELLVEEGTPVKQGQPLARLESRTLRELEVKAAINQLNNAKARLAVERQLANVKIEGAKLNVKKAEAATLTTAAHQKKIELLEVGLALAQKDQKRVEGLSKDLASKQERERQALLVQQAESELASAQAMLNQLVRINELGMEAARLELAAAGDAKKQLPFTIPIASLKVNCELAEAQFRRTQVVAPCSGTILRTFVRPGETIANKPILQMANTERMVVMVEVYENEIKHLRIGQPALVASRAFPSPYDQKGLSGKVTRIGRMINTPVLKSVDPFAPADRHVIEVRVELDEEGSRPAASLSNMQVDVRFPKRD